MKVMNVGNEDKFQTTFRGRETTTIKEHLFKADSHFVDVSKVSESQTSHIADNRALRSMQRLLNMQTNLSADDFCGSPLVVLTATKKEGHLLYQSFRYDEGAQRIVLGTNELIGDIKSRCQETRINRENSIKRFG